MGWHVARAQAREWEAYSLVLPIPTAVAEQCPWSSEPATPRLSGCCCTFSPFPSAGTASHWPWSLRGNHSRGVLGSPLLSALGGPRYSDRARMWRLSSRTICSTACSRAGVSGGSERSRTPLRSRPALRGRPHVACSAFVPKSRACCPNHAVLRLRTQPPRFATPSAPPLRLGEAWGRAWGQLPCTGRKAATSWPRLSGTVAACHEKAPCGSWRTSQLTGTHLGVTRRLQTVLGQLLTPPALRRPQEAQTQGALGVCEYGSGSCVSYRVQGPGHMCRLRSTRGG